MTKFQKHLRQVPACAAVQGQCVSQKHKGYCQNPEQKLNRSLVESRGSETGWEACLSSQVSRIQNPDRDLHPVQGCIPVRGDLWLLRLSLGETPALHSTPSPRGTAGGAGAAWRRRVETSEDGGHEVQPNASVPLRSHPAVPVLLRLGCPGVGPEQQHCLHHAWPQNCSDLQNRPPVEGRSPRAVNCPDCGEGLILSVDQLRGYRLASPQPLSRAQMPTGLWGG